MHKKSVCVNLKIWRQLLIINVSDGNNSVVLSVAVCSPVGAGLVVAQGLIPNIYCLVSMSVLLRDICLKQNGSPSMQSL